MATFVSHASIVPHLPRVLVGIARQHHTWKMIETGRVFAVHLLSEDEMAWVWPFGLQSGRDVDKFAGLSWKSGVTGCPVLTEAPAWLECRVETQLDTGDRTLYLAEVLEGGIQRAFRALTLKRLLELAPPERLRDLKQGLERDAAIDAAAIQAWRASRDTTRPTA
jgi:flavin reductase (DIM6/NTAB) family NADH-FMN oxidoreductase RutF